MNHRNEIDGLRAIAVLPVIFFHAEFPGFSGGFVGVDVFFVISGFLITRIILDELLSGNFSLLSFYERRARRILPALFVVMATTFAISWFVLLPFDFKALAKSAWAVVFFLSNFFFWLDSGYWSTDAQLLPLLHTWSLAIEEQFYLFFPLLLMLLVKLAHRDNRHIKLAAFGLLLTSLLTAEWMSRTNPDAAFFLLPFRGWELLLGALVAVYHFDANKATLTSRQNEAGSLLGLALIVFSVATYDRTTPFPGLYALAPTLGAALIILCARQGTLVGRLLSTPIFVGIGLISYSAYLWHHPLFALARHNSLEDLSAPTYLGLCAATLLLAYLSWRFVEQPFRQKTLFKRRAIFGFTGLATIGFVAIASIVYKNKGFEDRIPGFEQVAAQFPWQRSNIACSSIDLSLAHGVNALCSQDQPLNDADPAPVDIALYGDSHADAMLPAIVAMTKNDQSSHIYLGLGGCVPLLGVDIRAGVWPERVCRDLA